MRIGQAVGIFGRKRRSAPSKGRHAAPEPVEDGTVTQERSDESAATAGTAANVNDQEGPFELVDAPDDNLARVDLGSVRVPVPENAQVQVELDPENGEVRAVHVATEYGQVTISAYAAPKSGGLWNDVRMELADQLKSEGAQVSTRRGTWGLELSAVIGEVTLHVVGVDGPRWMLRGLIASPREQAQDAPAALREMVRKTIVDRDPSPMPVRTPLPITLPEAVAEHVAEQQAQRG